MAVKAVALVRHVEGFASPTSCTLNVFIHVPVSLGPFPGGSDPQGSLVVTVDPTGLVATVNQQIRDAVKTWATDNLGVAFEAGDTVKLVGSF